MLPNHFDQSVFYFVLHKLFDGKEFKTLELKTTRYEIAKNVLPNKKVSGEHYFKRIMEALRRWKSLTISFKGVFYENDNHTERHFSKIDDVILDSKTKQLYIRFNQQYIQLLNETNYYKYIDFNMYRNLSRGSSRRLYEILCKTLEGHDLWLTVNALAEKMAMDKRKSASTYYPSDVLATIIPAVKEINEKTDITIHCEYFKTKKKFKFKRLDNKKTIIPAKKDSISLHIKPARKANKATEIAEQPKLQESKNIKIAACMEYYKTLNEIEQKRIRTKALIDPFLVIFKTEEEKIYGYMTNTNQWQPAENK